ncbi:hypothetical protein BDA99DRAFT_544122 [Phascolomyces articulosus]|uniref:Uncharacterized protein n=1 Tax=Phascolomyces articulosus TaxID=60185 RepID=A0AAD5P8L8_9FUNG|nr:hypothetical protein BDA99DRAFT_544122 [Phascolomyces articulosus]
MQLTGIYNVGKVYRHAYQRISTREHDCVYAFKNIFPDLIDHMEDHENLRDLIFCFYGLLARKKNDPGYDSAIQQYTFSLSSSWTGIHGGHENSIIIRKKKSTFQSCGVIELQTKDISAFPFKDKNRPCNLSVFVQLDGV